MSVEIPLTRGFVALIDEEDHERVASRKWQASVRKHGAVYVTDSSRSYLHTFLTGWDYVDHINGNGLDNRRANLRPATGSQNAYNKGPLSNNTSGFKGVSLHGASGRWVAKIYAEKVAYNLGYYGSPADAARAYDAAANELHGEFARLNFPDETPGRMYVAVAWQSRTQCPKGHVYDDENTYRYQGRRQCKRCKLQRSRAARAARRGVAA
jgi:hypothetical protein